jgi:hypothetical protein
MFNGNVNDLLKRFKRDYLDNGTERYFYRESAKGDIKIVGKNQFKYVFETKIKPNFDKGAEYAHIKEYET